ncbi:peroxidase [Oryctes borbonicus]|uniref:Peroxidase n=1 Tax=Oryctes borbonicus TaxID=1629725 RepID=A0A0T6AUK1_9SCAR|nr:peroxidase [Oryctes borbonicus]
MVPVIISCIPDGELNYRPFLDYYHQATKTVKHSFIPRIKMTAVITFLGIWMPRVSIKTKLPLPSPRMISTSLFVDVDAPNYEYTSMLSYFGQFISHDITFSVDITFGKLNLTYLFQLFNLNSNFS